MGLKLFENKSIEARKDETYPFCSHAIITITDTSTHTLLRHFMHKHTSSTSTAHWAGSEVLHVETTPDLTEERRGPHGMRAGADGWSTMNMNHARAVCTVSECGRPAYSQQLAQKLRIQTLPAPWLCKCEEN